MVKRVLLSMSLRSTHAVLMEPPSDGKDLISELPDECLALILQRVRHSDLKSCTLVCRKWLFLQGQSLKYLTLRSPWFNISSIPFLFSRFSYVTKLVLQSGNHPQDAKIKLSDEELELISIKCINLTTLKFLYMFHEYVTEVGMAALGTHATRLKKFSCRYGGYAAKTLNAFLSHSSSLETITLYNFWARTLIHPGAAAASLKSINLKYITDNPQFFEPLIVGSKNLTSLKIYRCRGDWSEILNMVASRDNSLFEVYLTNVDVISDVALSAISNFSNLEILHIISDSSWFQKFSLNDEALISISTKCLNLTTFKLTGQCHVVTHVGMAALGLHAKRLKTFSCRNCKFGAKGLNALVSNSLSLQEISVKNLYLDGSNHELVYPCAVGSSLKSILLKDLNDNQCQCLAPLITGSKNLTSLRLLRCLGNWDNVFSMLANGENSLYEVHLNQVQISDAGLSALSSFSKLEILHVIATPDCTNRCIVSVVEQCNLLRELHIEKKRMNKNLGEDGLFSIRKYNAKLQVVKHRTKMRPFWQNLLT